jgi:predicted transcriptional regulator of viral defense system
MSGLEQILYFSLVQKDQRVFTIQDVTTILQVTADHARNITSSMVKKNVAERIKPGLFVRIPESIILDKKQYTEDAVLIAAKVNPNGYLSHYTALSLHGLAERYITDVYVTTTKHHRKITYHEIMIHYIQSIPSHFFGFTTIPYLNGYINVSDIERTVLDVVTRPMYAGGDVEMIQCLQNVDEIDYKKLVQYVKRFNSKITARKVGYLLDTLKNMKPPQTILQELKDFSGSNTYYFNTTQSGVFESKWQLIVPTTVVEILHADEKRI